MAGRGFRQNAGAARGSNNNSRGRGVAGRGVAGGRIENTNNTGRGGAQRGAPTNQGQQAGRGRGVRGQAVPARGAQRGQPAPRGGATNTRAFVGQTLAEKRGKGRAQQYDARMDLVEAGKAVAVDIEGVNLGRQITLENKKQYLGRISIVNEDCEVVFDTFAFYPKSVNAYPPQEIRGLGVLKTDIREDHGAQSFDYVLEEARKIFDKAGIVVTHSLKSEENFMRGLKQDAYVGTNFHTGKPVQFDAIDVAGVNLDKYITRDTQIYSEYVELAEQKSQKGNLPGLKMLAIEVLGLTNFRDGEHDSVDDARATMQLYTRRKAQIEQQYKDAADRKQQAEDERQRRDAEREEDNRRSRAREEFGEDGVAKKEDGTTVYGQEALAINLAKVWAKSPWKNAAMQPGPR